MAPAVNSAAEARTAKLAAGALVLNALVWGVSWWPFRQLQGYGLHPLWATATMYLMASLLVVGFVANALVRPVSAQHHFQRALERDSALATLRGGPT